MENYIFNVKKLYGKEQDQLEHCFGMLKDQKICKDVPQEKLVK